MVVGTLIIFSTCHYTPYWPSACSRASVKRPWAVFVGCCEVWEPWLVFLVKSVKVVRGCRVRFVPRWKRGRWRSVV